MQPSSKYELTPCKRHTYWQLHSPGDMWRDLQIQMDAFYQHPHKHNQPQVMQHHSHGDARSLRNQSFNNKYCKSKLICVLLVFITFTSYNQGDIWRDFEVQMTAFQ